jgi:hypothetical protein
MTSGFRRRVGHSDRDTRCRRVPAASLATAVSVCCPFATEVVSQLTAYGADESSTPRFDPSTLNCTPAMPTLSEAAAETMMADDTVAPLAGELIDTAGFVVSSIGAALRSR